MSDSSTGTAVLCSGGLDSAILLHHLADEGDAIHPFFVRQGFPWERVELSWLERFLEATAREELHPVEVVVMPLADLYPADHFGRGGSVPPAGTPDEDCYLPGRNVTLLAKAGVLAAARGLGSIALGPLKSNPFPDATPMFFRTMQEAMSLGLGQELIIRAPFLAFSKSEVLLLGRDLPLELTFSCMDPAGELHCGRCAKCHERRQAFTEAGVRDQTEYAV